MLKLKNLYYHDPGVFVSNKIFSTTLYSLEPTKSLAISNYSLCYPKPTWMLEKNIWSKYFFVVLKFWASFFRIPYSSTLLAPPWNGLSWDYCQVRWLISIWFYFYQNLSAFFPDKKLSLPGKKMQLIAVRKFNPADNKVCLLPILGKPHKTRVRIFPVEFFFL